MNTTNLVYISTYLASISQLESLHTGLGTSHASNRVYFCLRLLYKKPKERDSL